MSTENVIGFPSAAVHVPDRCTPRSSCTVSVTPDLIWDVCGGSRFFPHAAISTLSRPVIGRTDLYASKAVAVSPASNCGDRTTLSNV